MSCFLFQKLLLCLSVIPCNIIKLYILTYMHRNKQKCSLFMNLKMTVVFMTNVWLNIGLHVKVCFQFFICVLTVYLASKWMLLGFGRGYNNQVTVAFCSSDVTKHVLMTCTVLLSGKIVLTFLRSTVV